MNGLGDWLSDIAANLLCVVVVILAILALVPPEDPDAAAWTARSGVPIGGSEAVDMLKRRVHPAPSVGFLDVRSTDLRAGGAAGAAQWDVFVFDHAGFAAAVDRIPDGAAELSVPRALRSPDGHDWSSAFLALGGDDPDRFRDGLVALLSGHDTTESASMPRAAFGRRLLPLANAAAAALALVGILLLARRRA